MSIKSFICIALLFPFIVFSQKKDVDSSVIEVKYYVKFLGDTLNVSSAKEDLLSLRVGKSSSIFRSDLRESSDSLSHKIIESAMLKGANSSTLSAPDLSGVRRPKFIQEVYYTNGRILVYDKIRRNTFAFEPINKANWKLLNESKTISGYKCQKAITKYGNKNIIAWYTTEIPFQEGPYTFKGLPGLVIGLEDDKQYFSFILKAIKRVKKPIVPISNVIETSYQKFNAKRQEVKNDPVGSFSALTNQKFSKDAEERIRANNRAKNNQLD